MAERNVVCFFKGQKPQLVLRKSQSLSFSYFKAPKSKENTRISGPAPRRIPWPKYFTTKQLTFTMPTKVGFLKKKANKEVCHKRGKERNDIIVC